MKKIRQPIVTIAGHVDHGKTSILDYFRGSTVAAKEAGLITQKISFTCFPAENIKIRCANLLKKLNIDLVIPGFLFIDTPGHAAFTNLRKRGGSLADLAILVIDINEGIKPQTSEVIQILKANKVPFIVALNKIDNVSSWKKPKEKIPVKESLEKQSELVKSEFERKLYDIIGTLSLLKFEADLFWNIKDFTKQLALIPCSAKTGEGMEELIAMLAGLAQKFLQGKLELSDECKGTILEVRKDSKMTYIEAIIYDGKLKLNDNLIVASLENPIETKVRALFKALPLCKGFESAKEVEAASGLQLQLTNHDVLLGMPFVVCNNERKKEEIKKQLQKEISEKIRLDKEGIVIKADSLGSLEALMYLLRQKNIEIIKASIGNITKQDIMSAYTNQKFNQLNSVILGFNVSLNEDEEKESSKLNVKIITGEVVYKIIENFEEWQKEKQRKIEREKLSELTLPFKIKLMKNCIFRQSKPAICGFQVLAGSLQSGKKLMNIKGEEIGRIKAVQSENKSVEKAEKGSEVAVSIPNVTIGRQIKEEEILYSNLTEEEFRKLKKNKNLLTQDEIKILQEIAKIKRKERLTWGV